MSDTQQVWMVLWARAATDPSPFEIDDAVPEIAARLGVAEERAKWVTAGLLKELERLPEGRQYFAVEGNAVVFLEEFAISAKDEASALVAYPFEL